MLAGLRIQLFPFVYVSEFATKCADGVAVPRAYLRPPFPIAKRGMKQSTESCGIGAGFANRFGLNRGKAPLIGAKRPVSRVSRKGVR